MASQFSKQGKYFALLSNEGKLKIWNVPTGKLEQEFTPNYHLTCPCTCLQFIESQFQSNSKGVSPKKKKRRDSQELKSSYIVLGTNNGLLLVYSIANANVIHTLNSNTNAEISCLTWTEGSSVYTGIDQSVVCFNLEAQNVKDKWKCGNDKIKAIKEVSNNRLLVASKSIKLWDTKKKNVLKSYIGHSSDVCILEYVIPSYKSGGYFVTGSKADRLLSCWSLNEQGNETNAVATFLMSDMANSISIINGSENTTHLAALTRGGAVHFYQHTLNGKCKNPLKPKTTIQIASDTGQTGKEVTPIPIIGAVFEDALTLKICHGTSLQLTFENVDVKLTEKLQCLVRSEANSIASKTTNDASKIKRPIVGDNVEYLTPHSIATPSQKRKVDGKTTEVPMELRLENLILTKNDSKVPRADNLAQLLIQGIHSKDKTILRSVLTKQDDGVITSTVKRLPITAIEPLLRELTEFIQGKTLSCSTATFWLKKILQVHSGILLSNPELQDLLSPILKSIESRLLLQNPLSKLHGKLDLFMSQVNSTSSEDCEAANEPQLTYIDNDSSDSEVEKIDSMYISSENEWTEDESEEELLQNNEMET